VLQTPAPSHPNGVEPYLSNWQTNLITVWQSGKPFTITSTRQWSGQSNRERRQSKRAVPLNSGGNDRPDQLGDARLGHKPLSQFFNTAQFTPQPLGTVGSAQRNSLFGPDFRHVDLSLFKNFPVKEQVNVQFRVECFNISDTPNFYLANGQPGDEFGNAGFPQISQTDPNYVPREYQFVLKVQF
jgi:hypothetical protein